MNKVNSLLFKFAALLPIFCAADPWPVPPSNISNPGIDASGQDLAIDANGNVVAVWIENGFVMSRFNPISGSWSSPINTVSNSGASAPQVVLDDNGTGTAIWVENGLIKTASQPLNGSWSAPQTLSGAGASSPSIALDLSGDIVAAWVENGLIMSATKLIAGDWPATPDTISASGASLPQVAVGTNGNVAVVWQGIDQSVPVIFAAVKDIAGSWSAAQIISSAGIKCAKPNVAVSSDGKATAVWFRYDVSGSQYSNVVVQSASMALNGAWSSPVDISNPGVTDPSQLICRIGVDGGRYAIAIWTTSFNGSTFNEQWNVRIDDKWSGSNDLAGYNLLAYDVDVAVDYKGNAYMAWMYLDPMSSTPIVQGFVNDLKSLQPLSVKVWTLSAGGQNAYPVAVSNKSGSALYGATVWLNNNGSYNGVQALTATFPIVAPPTQLTVAQQGNNFGVLTELYNLLQWQASTTLNVIGYRIFRNGIMVQDVGANVLSYEDQNRISGETVTYSVVAYDDIGFQSDPVTSVFSN